MGACNRRLDTLLKRPTHGGDSTISGSRRAPYSNSGCREDSFVRVDTHAVAQPGDCRRLPDAQNCAVENRSARHRWPGRPMDASRIYRACLPHSRAWEVPEIPKARSASRPLSCQSTPLVRPRMLASSQSQSRSLSRHRGSPTVDDGVRVSKVQPLKSLADSHHCAPACFQTRKRATSWRSKSIQRI